MRERARGDGRQGRCARRPGHPPFDRSAALGAVSDHLARCDTPRGGRRLNRRPSCRRRLFRERRPHHRFGRGEGAPSPRNRSGRALGAERTADRRRRSQSGREWPAPNDRATPAISRAGSLAEFPPSPSAAPRRGYAGVPEQRSWADRARIRHRCHASDRAVGDARRSRRPRVGRCDREIGSSYLKFGMFENPDFKPGPGSEPGTARISPTTGERKHKMSEVSMSWWLSQSVQAELDLQICDRRNRKTLADLADRLSHAVRSTLAILLATNRRPAFPEGSSSGAGSEGTRNDPSENPHRF